MTHKLKTSQIVRIKSLALSKQRSSHDLMNEAIEPNLRTTETNQIILARVDDSIAHFDATGLHITQEEVKAWAKEVKSNRNAKLPECHL